VSFLVAAALAVGLFVVAPVLAHLLRRSRADEREFPPARLVPVAQPVARQRSRVEDRALLAVRSLMVLGLAVLGATPFVRCSRLSIARNAGGSVALALVVDDSLSMRAHTAGGKIRFALALDGARELLATAREGDAVAVVLAGSPARLALAATTDLGAARRALGELEVSDRATDLAGAIEIARSALKQLPHTDRRVVLLSDFAGAEVPPGEPAVWAPLAKVRAAVDDCGVMSAESHGRRASVLVACSSAAAARGRSLEIVVGSGAQENVSDAGPPAPPARAGDVLASAKLESKSGEQVVTAEIGMASIGLDARLTGKDAIPEDDAGPLAPESAKLSVGVLTDPSTSSATTGGASVLEQALDAFAQDLALKPLAVLPEEEKDLTSFAAILLDDPAGLGPESRGSLDAWLERGGVAAAWLGPRSESALLGATLEPFAHGAVRWEKTRAAGLDAKSLAWLGAPGASLANLAPEGRIHLDGALPSGARVTARWNDGQVFAAERSVGRGLVLTLGLPVSVDQSDLALRPGFLALLDYVIDQAVRRAGPRRTEVGTPWSFASSTEVSVEGPDGPLGLAAPEPGAPGDAQRSVTPIRAGRYRVSVDGSSEARVVTLDPREITTPPREPDTAAEHVQTGGVDQRVDVSSQLALALLLLLVAELTLRAAGRTRARARRRRRDPAPPDDSPRAA
jgi:von Willebrand factor type A domain/Aerotolerance regulator N-terminal